MGKIRFIIIFLSIYIKSYSQSISKKVYGTDTINILNNKLIIQIPKLSNTSKLNYEEGTIYTYSSIKDAALITILIGSNAIIDINSENKTCVYTEEINFNDNYVDARGYCINIKDNQKRLYFRKINVTPYRIYILYENVNECDLHLYENSFNNIKFIKIN